MFASRFSFDGKIILITGGSRGLGLALAREACARRARVALLARDPNELARACDDLRRRGGDTLPVECDLLEPTQIKQAVDKIVDYFGALDVVINNAGIIEVGPLAHMKPADFDAIHGEQVLPRRFLGCDSRGVSARRYLRHHRHTGNDAHRLAQLREIQGRPRSRIQTIYGSEQIAICFHFR